jgi:hypothetical protein
MSMDAVDFAGLIEAATVGRTLLRPELKKIRTTLEHSFCVVNAEISC